MLGTVAVAVAGVAAVVCTLVDSALPSPASGRDPDASAVGTAGDSDVAAVCAPGAAPTLRACTPAAVGADVPVPDAGGVLSIAMESASVDAVLPSLEPGVVLLPSMAVPCGRAAVATDAAAAAPSAASAGAVGDWMLMSTAGIAGKTCAAGAIMPPSGPLPVASATRSSIASRDAASAAAESCAPEKPFDASPVSAPSANPASASWPSAAVPAAEPASAVFAAGRTADARIAASIAENAALADVAFVVTAASSAPVPFVFALAALFSGADKLAVLTGAACSVAGRVSMGGSGVSMGERECCACWHAAPRGKFVLQALLAPCGVAGFDHSAPLLDQTVGAHALLFFLP